MNKATVTTEQHVWLVIGLCLVLGLVMFLPASCDYGKPVYYAKRHTIDINGPIFKAIVQYSRQRSAGRAWGLEEVQADLELDEYVGSREKQDK